MERGTFYKLILHNQDMIIGAALAICGNLLISVSMNLQKYALTRLQAQKAAELSGDRNQQQHDTSTSDTDVSPPDDKTDQSDDAGTEGREGGTVGRTEEPKLEKHQYLRSRLWLFAIGLMIFGEVGNFMAYAFAPASVVAPLGTTTVVANTYIAIVFLGEKFRFQDALGTSLIVVGAFLIVLFATSDDSRLDANDIYHHLIHWPFLIYMGVEVFLFASINYLLFKKGHNDVVLFILAAALLASLTVIAAKALSGMITITVLGDSQLQYFIFYVMIIIIPVTGVLQVRYVTQAMQFHNATVVVPTFFVFFTLSAILAGIFFYGEFDGLVYLQIVIFLCGCGFSFLGVYFISSNRGSSEDPSDRSKSDEGVQTELPQSFVQFPYYNEMVQPQSEKEDLPLVLGPVRPVRRRSFSQEVSADGLFNPHQDLAIGSSDVSLSPKPIPARSKDGFAPPPPGRGKSSRSMGESAGYPVSSNNTLFGTRDLSWDPSVDGLVYDNDNNFVYRRVPPRLKSFNDSSSSSNS